MGAFPNISSGGAVYRFSRRIGRGGMGEIYLALQECIGGLERLVVVKRIDPQLGDDERLGRQLLQEARLAATIQHPNVVQMVDIGRDASGYFLVMEYLSGESLVYLSRTLRARGERVPPAIACRIAADVAAALHCAHTATDAAGRPQPIVHRDVTPSNLILCYNGAVKVVDFGVARANLPEGPTGGGIKGKLSYLAPEQVDDRPLDGRTDVFQLGICLHELLTGQRLFRGENDHARVAAVLMRPIPAPSEIVPSLHASIDRLVLWALERDPDRRPASADHFRLALESALADHGTVGPHDLAAWMKGTFPERMAARVQFERRCVAEMREGRTSDRPPAVDEDSTSGGPPAGDTASALRFVYEPMGADSAGAEPIAVGGNPPDCPPSIFSPGGSGGAEEAEGADDSDARPSASGSSASRSGSRSGSVQSTGSAPAPAPSRRTAWIASGLASFALALITGTAIAWQVDADVGGPPPVAPLVVAAPPGAIIEIDGFEVGRGSYRVSLPMDGARHVLTVRADGYETVEVDFTDQPPPARILLERIGGERRTLRARKAPRKNSRRRGHPGPLTDNPDPWRDERSVAR